jgi:hypothetical protein
MVTRLRSSTSRLRTHAAPTRIDWGINGRLVVASSPASGFCPRMAAMSAWWLSTARAFRLAVVSTFAWLSSCWMMLSAAPSRPSSHGLIAWGEFPIGRLAARP